MPKTIIKLLFLLIGFLIKSFSYNYNGYDWDKSEYIDIESPLEDMQEGETVDIYRYGGGKGYSTMTIDEIDKNTVKGIDEKTGEDLEIEISK